MTFIESFAAAMIGHFVGDYLFQTQWMALNKSAKGWLGHLACTIHVLCYTFAVALFTGWHPLFLLVVATPHWVIDRWSLANYWLTFKNGFSTKELWKDGEPGTVYQFRWIAKERLGYSVCGTSLHLQR